MKAPVLLLLVCLGAVFAQFPQQNLYPQSMDGFDVVMLNDMSFVTEIHYQSFTPGNFSMYIFGGAVVRSIFPQIGKDTFYVGASPSDYWFLPFVDVHSFSDAQNNSWFIGPIEPFMGMNHIGDQLSGYELEVAMISSTFGFRPRFYAAPIGLDGTFFAVSPLALPWSNIVNVYLAGFWLGGPENQTLQFGVYRAHFNMTEYMINPYLNNSAVVSVDPAIDAAPVVTNSMFTAYNEYFKPFIFHLWNTTSLGAPANTTYTYIVDPATNSIFTVQGNWDPTVPLAVWQNQTFHHDHGYISSAQIYYPANLLLIGIGAWGMGTGEILVFNLATFSVQTVINLPTNYSDPKALVIDEFEGVLYVGMNGGGAILRYNLTTFNLTGSQNLPFYLHRVWAGLPTFEHVYFVTNEQHSKVFRVAKADFCPSSCSFNQYCKKGSCVCLEGMVMSEGNCQWQPVVHEKEIAKRNKAGETALGILFMFSFIAAAAGWFMWYRTRRSSYQAV